MIKYFCSSEDVPFAAVFERWHSSGDWDDRSDSIRVQSWEDCIATMAPMLPDFSAFDRIAFQSPAFDLDEYDTNNIAILMRDFQTIVQATFHFTKVRMT